jgi:hypothetical protein
MFCCPTGAFSRLHLEMIRRAGFIGLRTVEIGSLDFRRERAGLVLMPTTVQAYPHGLAALARNAIKRMAFSNLWRFVAHNRTTNWLELAGCLLDLALGTSGVFHLCGHSWELDEADQWTRLRRRSADVRRDHHQCAVARKRANGAAVPNGGERRRLYAMNGNNVEG